MTPVPPITMLLVVLVICFTALGSILAVAIVGGLGLAWEAFRAFVEATVTEPEPETPRVEDEFL